MDLLAGFRVTYLGQQTGLNANEPAIDAASTDLVNLFAQQLTTPGSNVQTLIQQKILNGLTSLEGRHPPLPVEPNFGDQPSAWLEMKKGKFAVIPDRTLIIRRILRWNAKEGYGKLVYIYVLNEVVNYGAS